ncbi:hypothetical protein SAMN05428961_1134 [Paenibacillus sp. OK060]|nr:hypothetical protein SAMN05428961_1134 [Paenibacillus sp. OK060]
MLSNFNPRTPYGVRLIRELHQRARIVISIHALHTECDHTQVMEAEQFFDFNPRTPYGVRRDQFRSVRGYVISIHALHTECDMKYMRWLSLWI